MTSQTPDKIRIDGKECILYCGPYIPRDSNDIENYEKQLETIMHKNPDVLIALMEGKESEIDKNLLSEINRLSEEVHKLESTACWRGYVASWELKDKKLYLVDVNGKFRLKQKAPLFANWFSGEIIVPAGEYIGEFDVDYLFHFSAYEHIYFEHGIMVSSEIKEASSENDFNDDRSLEEKYGKQVPINDSELFCFNGLSDD